MAEDAFFYSDMFGAERPEDGLYIKEFDLHQCTVDEDLQKFYAPDSPYVNFVSSTFETLLCLDHPEDIKFFGNYNTDLGNTIEIAFYECIDKSCLSPEKRKTFLVDAFVGDAYLIVLSNQQQFIFDE